MGKRTPSLSSKSWLLLALCLSYAPILTRANCGDCDENGRQYAPVVCAALAECECPDKGKPVCALCPFDKGSRWKDSKVCQCTELPTGSTVECSLGRRFSPRKVKPSGQSTSAPSTTKALKITERESEDSVESRSDAGEDRKSTISTGAIAGLALAGVVALLVTLSLLYYFCLPSGPFRRRKGEEEARMALGENSRSSAHAGSEPITRVLSSSSGSSSSGSFIISTPTAVSPELESPYNLSTTNSSMRTDITLAAWPGPPQVQSYRVTPSPGRYTSSGTSPSV